MRTWVEDAPLTDQSILWRRLDRPGHDSARLVLRDSLWHLAGTAVFLDDAGPCRLDYLVVCDAAWRTVSARVSGWAGPAAVQLDIAVDAARRWRVNGTEYSDVAGCIDLDFGFSPATNLLPVRRLDLAIGQSAEVPAAWLGVPEPTLERLVQRYCRTDVTTYHYESAGGTFVTDLEVNTAGFVTRYAHLWVLEASLPRRKS